MNEQRAKWCWPRAPRDVPFRLFSPGRCIGSSCFRTHDLEDIVACARCRAWFEPHPNVCPRNAAACDVCYDPLASVREAVEAAGDGPYHDLGSFAPYVDEDDGADALERP